MKRDGRSYDHQTLEAIRLAAVKRVRDGEPAAQVIAAYGFNRTTIYRWLKSALLPGIGIKALRARKATGRPRRLTPVQERQVFRWINGRDPRQYGLQACLWTRATVAELIEKRFHVRLGVTAAGELLVKLGLAPHRPLHCTDRHDRRITERWRRDTYPSVAKQARSDGGKILFWDWPKIGIDVPQREIPATPGRTSEGQRGRPRQSIHAAALVTANGAFWFRTFEGALNAERFIALLARMMKYRTKPIHLVIDRLPAMSEAAVRDYVAALRGRLTLHFLPGRGSDLNPGDRIRADGARPALSRPLPAESTQIRPQIKKTD